MNRDVVWTKGHKLKRFDIIPTSRGGDFLNMMGQLNSLKYYEDVIDPSIHVEIVCVDTHGFYNQLPIRSGSPVRVEITHPSQEKPLKFDLGSGYDPLVITNISNHVADNKREAYVLTLETKAAINNHITRVWEKKTGSITSTVKNILSSKLQVPGNKMMAKNFDTTSNTYEFYGNYRRPFKVISDLCPKSIPSSVDGDSPSSGSGGFLFFETQDGWNFRSTDKLFASDPVEKYLMTTYKTGMDPKNNFMLASQPVWKESHDILKKLRSGAYKTANWYYDVLTRKVTFYEFSYDKAQKHQEKANKEAVLPPDYKDSYSRIILGTIDKGTTTTDVSGSGAAKPQDQATYQAQSNSRYSSVFAQTLNITVPMNLSLRAGNMLELEFPDLNNPRGKNAQSGKYMIARLAHEFGNPQGDFTGLTLVRDTFQKNK